LLKNNIAGDEYVLLSEEYLQTEPAESIKPNFSWTQLRNGFTNYEHLGDIYYRYAYLTPLRLLVTNNRQFGNRKSFSNVITVNVAIQAPTRFVLRIISNFRLKPAWVLGMSKVHYDVSKATRMGISYKCDLNRGQIDIQTIQTFIGEEHIEYVEKVGNFRIFPNSMLFYYLTAVDNQNTNLEIKFHYSRIPTSNNFFYFFMRRRMKIFLGKSIRRLQELSERMYAEHPK